MRSVFRRTIPELVRFNISLSVTLSAFTAEVLAAGRISDFTLPSLAGIFLLSCGASALNQYQEKDKDGKMERTRFRPVPVRAIAPKTALGVALLLLSGGFSILIAGSFYLCGLLGLLNILWYNGLYTWLKQKTPFAVVPGALTGVIPVFMGWTAAGGEITDPGGMLLALFVFLWQIPHFWLLMMKYEKDYRNAGYPVMTDIFSIQQFRNIIIAWVMAATVTSLVLIWYTVWLLAVPKIFIVSTNILILVLFIRELSVVRTPRYKVLNGAMNFFLLLVLIMIILEKVAN